MEKVRGDERRQEGMEEELMEGEMKEDGRNNNGTIKAKKERNSDEQKKNETGRVVDREEGVKRSEGGVTTNSPGQ